MAVANQGASQKWPVEMQARLAARRATWRCSARLKPPAGVRRFFKTGRRAFFCPPALRGLATAARIGAVGRLVERIIDARWPVARSSGVARTRLIDDWICEAVAAGAGQLVILGAGFALPGVAPPRSRRSARVRGGSCSVARRQAAAPAERRFDRAPRRHRRAGRLPTRRPEDEAGRRRRTRRRAPRSSYGKASPTIWTRVR